MVPVRCTSNKKGDVMFSTNGVALTELLLKVRSTDTITLQVGINFF